MVKRIAQIMSLTLLLQCYAFSVTSHAAEPELQLTPEAKAAILMDMDTGTILYEKESDKQLAPASITKVMTMILIMEAIDSGKLTWDEKVRTSERAASMGGSQIFLEIGEEMTVEDMMKGIAIASGNDATVAMAEHIAGSEENFVKMMNEKAGQLGMKNTNFANTNGLPSPNHYSSAKDVALMSRELLKHEEITKFTSIYEDYLRKDSAKPFWLVNTNRLVKFYDGVDGLKTGFTQESKYCLTATAKRGNLRVIAVVMGTPTPKERNQNITSMLNYAFSQYESHPIYEKGDFLRQVKIDKGEESTLQMVVPHQISVLAKKGESVDLYRPSIHHVEGLNAPIKKGDVIGHVTITKNGETVAEIDIPAQEDLEKASFWTIFKRTTKTLFGFSSKTDKDVDHSI
ncbi:D-alanyl-D-alanine carboxypeptidase family protein [Bacillus horti]|uniref:serine-type D-Ala-D-Ala carboxypeptidase n=1 Tax=Caldalkalibacillus horti TaxID=77523 RepID=A0ABT9VU83_9BACI|nr:D-alanyl-D-alanine carboxypeptidase family protein [Bacillus horti]MDQ0164534.1 D-alanyl-D-alanine carboxypeptidase (penicillin-binding protein 5/6) [Bacillus horti]